MAQSLTALQLEKTIAPWRKVEMKRRTSSGYETDWQDVSDYVLVWPTITFETDSINAFSWRIGQCQLVMRNDEKQFASQLYNQSFFSGRPTRYKTLVRISTGLTDLDTDIDYPTSDSNIFYGFIEDINDGEMRVTFVILSMMSLLQTMPASILAGYKGVAYTAKEHIEHIRDYQDAGLNYVIQPFLSTSQWLLTCTGDTYTIATTTSLDDRTCFELMQNFAKAENYQVFMDKGGNINFKPRSAPTATAYYFIGPGKPNVNIEAVEQYDEGILDCYNKITCTLANDDTVVTNNAYTAGDGSSPWLYGVREFSWDNPYTDAAGAAIQNARLLVEVKNPKENLVLRTKYIAPNVDINDRVNVSYLGQRGGDGALFDYALFDINLFSDEKGGILIDNVDFRITGIRVDMNNFFTTFSMKKI